MTRIFVSLISFGLVAVLVLLASSSAVADQIYNFTFTSSGMDATGTIDVAGGVAQSGSINVTNVPLAADPNTLITAAGNLLPGNGAAQNHNGDNLPYDNLVTFANNPILTSNGIDFVAGQYDPTHYNTLIGLWGGDANGNPVPNEYTLFVGEAQLDGNGNVIPGESGYVYNYLSGSLTLTPVPEPSSAFLAICALIGFGILYRARLTSRHLQTN